MRTARPLETLLETAPPPDVGVITVNWDQCIWEESRFESVIQLHGVASDPESIVLPGEYADDDAFVDILENLGFSIQSEGVRNQVLRMFRGDFRRPLTAALQTAGFWLENAETICVWGLAFHPYDAEVCQLAWNAGRNARKAKTITVINPSEADRAMCKFLLSAPQDEFVELSA